MKIALACDWFAPQIGGIENHIADLALALRAHGHEAHVITSTPGPCDVDGIRVHRVDSVRVPGWRVVGDVRIAARVAALCVRERFDVIHGHSLQSPLAHVGMYAARRLGVPGVLTQHSLLGPAPTALLRFLDRRFGWAAWPTLLTAVSSAAAARARLATRRDDVRVLHAGIDLARWTRRRPAADDALTVACVTRLYAHKRTDHLLRAIPRVLAECRHAPRFEIVGDGPARGTLEQLAHRLGIAAHVAFTGPLPRTEIAAVLERAHVFVLPNPDEAFGIAALEARALGLPVVARSASGARDLVDHGRNGLLCNSVDDMARGIARLCDDQLLRAAMARHARSGLERFGWGHAVARHLELYDRALDQPLAATRRAV